jgi:hypothetical protein
MTYDPTLDPDDDEDVADDPLEDDWEWEDDMPSWGGF